MKNVKLFITLFVVILLLLAWLKISPTNIEKTNNEEITSGEYSDEETQILLYFLDADGKTLSKEYRYVSLTSIQKDMLKTIVEELLKGPKSNELLKAIPTETKLNSVTKDGNKAIVDFSAEFIAASDDEATKLQKIYSVVNTITEIKEITEVEIRINGDTIATKNRI